MNPAALIQHLRRADWLDRRITGYGIVVLLVSLGAMVWFYGGGTGLLDRRGAPLGADFVNLYAAGVLVREGRAPAVYDYQHFPEVERRVVGDPTNRFISLGWRYPPNYLVVAWAAALAPYIVALVLYLAITFALQAAVVWAIAPSRMTLLLLCAFPATLVNLANGQNGFLTAALLGGGLVCLPKRPLLAGALFGLLTFKPQLGVVIPFALLAAGSWRAVFGAIVAAAVFALISLALFGAETWAGFFDSLKLSRVILEQGAAGWEKLQSVYAAARLVGLPNVLAYALQGAVALFAIGGVVWLWRRDVPFALKASGLCIASLLVSPYAYDYDLVVLALPIAWMTMHGVSSGFADWEKLALALAWFLPIVARLLPPITGVHVMPFALIALYGLVLRRAATDQKPAIEQRL